MWSETIDQPQKISCLSQKIFKMIINLNTNFHNKICLEIQILNKFKVHFILSLRFVNYLALMNIFFFAKNFMFVFNSQKYS